MDEGKDIIGYFGFGFYLIFMVFDKVKIDILLYKSEVELVKWVCNEGGIEYEIFIFEERIIRGIIIILYINEESVEFLEEYKVREIIKKYCLFLFIEIYLEDENKLKEEFKYVIKKKEDGIEY